MTNDNQTNFHGYCVSASWVFYFFLRRAAVLKRSLPVASSFGVVNGSKPNEKLPPLFLPVVTKQTRSTPLKVTYPLHDRAVVLIVGKNEADVSSDSNGAGKTTLAMAPLWCLNGSTDSRPDGTKTSGLSTEMLNDKSKSGFVKVSDTITHKRYACCFLS